MLKINLIKVKIKVLTKIKELNHLLVGKKQKKKVMIKRENKILIKKIFNRKIDSIFHILTRVFLKYLVGQMILLKKMNFKITKIVKKKMKVLLNKMKNFSKKLI